MLGLKSFTGTETTFATVSRFRRLASVYDIGESLICHE
jgi:hypothetical protein